MTVTEKKKFYNVGPRTDIPEFSIAKEGVKSYAVYTIVVKFVDDRGCEEERIVYRR
jgi:hypothetical protein